LPIFQADDFLKVFNSPFGDSSARASAAWPEGASPVQRKNPRARVAGVLADGR
jgi:hypothetical protein